MSEQQNSSTTSKKNKKSTAQRLAELEAERTRLVAKKRKEDARDKIVMGSIFINFLKQLCETNKEGFQEYISGIITESKKLRISNKDIVNFTRIVEGIGPLPELKEEDEKEEEG